MIYFVYAIASIHKKYVYVGLTTDVEERIARHNEGYEKTTKPYAPFMLVFSETQKDRLSARKREKNLKGRSGKRFLYEVIRTQFPQLKQY